MQHSSHPRDTSLQTLIERRIEKMLTPLEHFIRKQAAASILLTIATILALVIANSSWEHGIHTISAMKIGVHVDEWRFSFSIQHLINDGLLTLFFFLIGLEVKLEMMVGQLRKPRQVVLILMAALGGMVVPGIIFELINHHGAGHPGWAIPMATDTAFAIGVLAVMARHVSIGVSVFLAALAIFDDIGAILVIALFYTHHIDVVMLFCAGIPLLLLFSINLMGVRNGWIYGLIGITLWWCIHASGIHATLAGILMAFAVPARSRISQRSFIARIRDQLWQFEKSDNVDEDILASSKQHLLISDIGHTVNAGSTPLQHWYSILQNPIAIFILPLFALFNAGIQLSAATLQGATTSPVTLGIIAGLVIGKPLGITLFGIAALRLSLGSMPTGMRFPELVGAGLLAGIGFTMSLFITTLAFSSQPELMDAAKIGVLIASVFSASFGALWLFLTRHK